MAGTASNSSILVIPEPEVEKYSGIVQLPPKSKLQVMSKCGGNIVAGNIFDTGILSRVDQYWDVTFRQPNQIRVRMYLQQRDDKFSFYTLMKPFHLELLSQNQVKSRHEMHFQSASDSDSVFEPTLLYHASWVNDDSWNETIDSVRIVFQACRETAGTCYESTLWNERSVQCKAALAEYTERDYSGLFLDTSLADVNIQCKEEIFPAHKTVLRSRSPVFKKILSQDLETKETVAINDFEPEVISVFLKFMYSGELDLMGEELCNSLFDLAVIYEVEALRMLCEHQLTDNITKDNCMSYFQKSVKSDAPLLRDASFETIKENCKELVFRNRENFKFFAKQFPDLYCDLAKIMLETMKNCTCCKYSAVY